MVNKTVVVANKLIEENKRLESENEQIDKYIHKLDEKMGLSPRKTETFDEMVMEIDRLDRLSLMYEKIYKKKEKIRSGDTSFEEAVEISEELEKLGIEISYWSTEGRKKEWEEYESPWEKALAEVEKDGKYKNEWEKTLAVVEAYEHKKDESELGTTFEVECEKIFAVMETYPNIFREHGKNYIKILAINQALKNVADRENSVLEGNLKEQYKDANEYIEASTQVRKKEFYERLKKYSKDYKGKENESSNSEKDFSMEDEESVDLDLKLEIEKYQQEMNYKCKMYEKFDIMTVDDSKTDNSNGNKDSYNRMDMINNSMLRLFAEKIEDSLEKLGYYSGQWKPVPMSFREGEFAANITTIKKTKFLDKKDLAEADEKFSISTSKIEEILELLGRFPLLNGIIEKIESEVNKDKGGR